MFTGKRILVAPLDWGLGHSTRCIPIIQAIQDRGAVAVIGADKGPLTLLRNVFPDLEYIRLPGVPIRYGTGEKQVWNLVKQFPRLLKSIAEERALLERSAKELRLDAVISDQRFGIRSPHLPSVVITHQVFPFTPIAQQALRKLNHVHLSRFDRCWIMDHAEAPGLAGELSHGDPLPANARYIGTMSRISAPSSSLDATEKGEPYRIVAVISGPEPQRTLLQDLLTAQLQEIEGEHLLVCGIPNDTAQKRIGRVDIVPHLDAEVLSAHMRSAELIISRSGYTTLMDLSAVGRSALLIPTPGQSEQEYLGRLHAGSGRYTVQRQDRIDIRGALSKVQASSFKPTQKTSAALESALDDLDPLL